MGASTSKINDSGLHRPQTVSCPGQTTPEAAGFNSVNPFKANRPGRWSKDRLRAATRWHGLSILPLVSFLLFLSLTSCDKFDGEQEIPAYLKIDSIGFYTDDLTQGTEKQYFADVWVYIDDDLIGGFEMPARVPILKEGQHKLEIRPGIILNGISDTRAPHPAVKPLVVAEYELVADSVIGFYGTTTYLDNAEFIWLEDFEDPSLAIRPATQSDTGIVRTQPANAPGAFLDEYSHFSGISHVDANRDYLMLVSDDGNNSGFVIDRGDFVILEFHYRMDLPMVVGLFIKKDDNTVEQRSFLIVNPTDEWKKIYVNFTPIVNETTDAVNFTVYFETYRSLTGKDGFVMLDNIKLVTRPNL